MQRRHILTGFLGTFLAFSASTAATAQQQTKLTFGLPGIPPVFVTTQEYVAQQQRFFQKYGLEVTLRTFDSGAAAARGVVAGDIDVSLSPSPLIANMITNANVDLVTIYGNPKPDWLIASLDPSKTTCESMKGQPIGVDSIGGARSIALTQMLFSCGLKAEDTQQVALGTNVHAAMSSGQLQLGVLHVDDVPIIEKNAGKKLITVINFNDVHKVNHYMAVTTTRKKLAEKRDAYVRLLAALVEAQRYIHDPKNAANVVKAAAPTGRSEEEARSALPIYVNMGFWPQDSGLHKENIEAIIKDQKAVGAFAQGKTPVSFDRYADLSIYQDALKLLK